MPVELPDHLVIADEGRVEIVDPAPMYAWRDTTDNWISMPVDRVAEAEAIVSQEVEHAAANRIRASHDLALGPRPAPAKLADRCLRFVERGKKAVARGAERREETLSVADCDHPTRVRRQPAPELRIARLADLGRQVHPLEPHVGHLEPSRAEFARTASSQLPQHRRRHGQVTFTSRPARRR